MSDKAWPRGVRPWVLRKKSGSGGSVELPGDMRWADELDWTELAQASPVRSLAGNPIVQLSRKKAGRPITLTGANCWIPLATIKKIIEWADSGEPLTLICPSGETKNVRFRLSDGALTNCAPVLFRAAESGEDPYTATVNLETLD